MELKFVEGLVALFERSGLAELDYSDGSGRLRLVRDGSGQIRSEQVAPDSVEAPPATSVTIVDAGPARHAVKAGLAGMMYMAPAPDQPPFVALGDRVEEGQTLGIVEAMKMLSPIESEWSGRIVEICVANAMPIEAGDILFVIEAEA